MRPVLHKGPFGYETVNVEAQRREDDSLLNWMAAMIRLRKECPEIGWGSWTLLKTNAPGVLGLRYEWKGNALVLLHNFQPKPREIRLRLKDDAEADAHEPAPQRRIAPGRKGPSTGSRSKPSAIAGIALAGSITISVAPRS